MLPTTRGCLRLLALTGSLMLLLANAASAEEMLAERLPEGVAGTATLTLQRTPEAGVTTNATLILQLMESLQPGDRLIIGQHWMDTVRLQNQDPQIPAFVSPVSTSQFEPVVVTLTGIYGGLDSLAEAVAFDHVGDSLIAAGNEIRFDVTSLVLPQASTRGYQLRIFHQRRGPAGYRDTGHIDTSPVEVMPAAFSQIRIAADMIARPGEPIAVSYEMLDRFGNRVPDRRMTFDLLVNGTFRQRVDATSSVGRIDDVRFEVPGVYQLELRSGGGGIRGLSNLVRVGTASHAVLWADMGRTSRRSDGTLDANRVSMPGVDYDLFLPADHTAVDEAQAAVGTDGIEGRIIDQALDKGGSKMLFETPNGDRLTVAMAEQPADLRYLTPDSLQLAEVVAGGSLYRWSGDRFAQQGYRVGFIGSSHSHQYPGDQPAVYTALKVRAGQSWFDALRQGQTWVSVGSKILLETQSTLVHEPTRTLSLAITAEAPIISIEVYKNGVPVAELVQGEPDPSLVALELSSASRPFSPIMSRPRNPREWIGYIATRDAVLGNLTMTPDGWQTRLDAGQRRLDFYTRTHGIARALILPISSVTEDTMVEIGLAEVLEDAAWLPSDRLPATIRGRNLLISATELEETAVTSIEVAGYQDRVSLRRLPAGLASQGEFSYRDAATPRIGDYYYFVIRLIDGSYAISSPQYLELPAGS